MDALKGRPDNKSNLFNTLSLSVGGTQTTFITAKNPQVKVANSALAEMIYDLKRSYESAGYLVGNLKAGGSMELEQYKPAKGVTRYLRRAKLNPDVANNMIRGFVKDGYNCIIFIHNHPNFVFGSYASLNEINTKNLLSNTDEEKFLAESRLIKGMAAYYYGLVSNSTLENRVLLEIYDESSNKLTIGLSDGQKVKCGINLRSIMKKKLEAFPVYNYELINRLFGIKIEKEYEEMRLQQTYSDPKLLAKVFKNLPNLEQNRILNVVMNEANFQLKAEDLTEEARDRIIEIILKSVNKNNKSKENI